MGHRHALGALIFSLVLVLCQTASANRPLCQSVFADPPPWGEADPPGTLRPRLKSLTHQLRTQQGDDFGDPSTPDLSVPGQVRVLTTNGEVLVWKDRGRETAAKRFLRGVRPVRERLRVYDADGKTALEPWDPTIEVFPEFGGERVLYAGVMTAPPGRRRPRWPEDNWRRRVSAFRWKADLGAEGRWVRVVDSVLGDSPTQANWVGHSYGHHFMRAPDGRVWMFYERVTEDRAGQPWTTEIFAREALSPYEFAAQEVPILQFGERVWPAARRHSGGALVEGPRPFQIGEYYLIGFSAGEYASQNYGIHLMWSRSLLGPYRPFMKDRDLRDFGGDVRALSPMTWGPGRPAFFEMEGRWWVLFHGIRKDDPERMQAQERDVFLAPVEFTSGPGVPRPRILPER